MLLLGIATIGSARSAYQVSRWNGVDTGEARAGAVLRIEASREYALATQKVTYDGAAVSQYAQAVATGNTAQQKFLRETIIRPGFLPMLDLWEQQIAAGETPTNLLSDQAYLDGLFATSTATDMKSTEAAAARSEEARVQADNYVRLTLFFASALFFAGITASFRTRFPRLLLLSVAGITLLVAGGLLAGYPIA